MRLLANDTVSKLVRLIPLILCNIDKDTIRKNVKLANAVRLMKIIVRKLETIENGQDNVQANLGGKSRRTKRYG
jgi:hypothetical protein